jgi:hypothetical protein
MNNKTIKKKEKTDRMSIIKKKQLITGKDVGEKESYTLLVGI